MKIYHQYPELYSLWRNALTKDKIEREVNFITDCFNRSKKPIKKIIDLGGGIGLHSDLLEKRGFEVTLFDISEKALEIANKNNPNLIIKKGSFEDINLNERYDACICMWTTFTYIINNIGRDKFFNWIRNHINHVVILDEGNFYLYPNSFNEVYYSEDKNNKIKIIRKWKMNKNFLRKTIFENEITDLRTNKIKRIKDNEVMQFLTLEQIAKLLGTKWKLDRTLGDYNINSEYNKESSSRLISLFMRNNKI
jgi:hypothetical protein